MDALIRDLEQRGYKVQTHGEEGDFPKTWITLDGETLLFGIDEKLRAQRHEATREELRRFVDPPRYDYYPTGSLALVIRNAPRGVQGKWADGKAQRVEDRLPRFIQGLQIAADREKFLRVEAERRRREWEEEAKKRRERERQARIERQKVEKLEADVKAWERACRLRAYVEELKKIPTPSEDLVDWINWAEKHIQNIDPIQNVGSLSFQGEDPFTNY